MSDITITFSEEELLRMKAFYQQEHVTVCNRLIEIKGILKILGVDTPSTEAYAPQVKRATSPVKASTYSKSTRKRRKKRGPKPTWSKFIIQQLKEADKPMTYQELIRNAMVLKHKTDAEKPKVKASILNSAFRLRNKENKIETIGKEGVKAKHIVLTSWLDDKGNLVSPYNHKYQELLLSKDVE